MRWLLAALLLVVASSSCLDEFRSWLTTNGVEWSGADIGLVGSRGRGLFAARNLSREETFVRIPLNLTLNIENIYETSLGSLLDDHEVSDTNARALFLAVEARNASSFWAPYLRILPRPPSLGTPLFFSQEELRELQLSSVKTFAQRRREAALENFHGYHQDITSLTNESDFLWALSIGWSRSFGVQRRDPEGNWHKVSSLVPVADMINSGGREELNTDCRTNPGSTHFECFVTRAVAAGEELLAPYGAPTRPYSNGQLLLDYGFALERNPADVVVFTLPPVEKGRLKDREEVFSIKMRLLRAFARRGEPNVFMLSAPAGDNPERRSLPPDLLTYARILYLTAPVITKVASLEKLVDAVKKGTPFSVEHEGMVAGTLSLELEKAEKAYPTTLEQDEQAEAALQAQLKACPSVDGCVTDSAVLAEAEACYSQHRRLYALRVRIGEKRVLRRLKDSLRAYFYTIANPLAGEGEGEGEETEEAAAGQEPSLRNEL